MLFEGENMFMAQSSVKYLNLSLRPRHEPIGHAEDGSFIGFKLQNGKGLILKCHNVV